MAIIIVCDGGCGAQSPDPKTGLFVANKWYKIKIESPAGEYRREPELIFCGECLKRIEGSFKEART